MKNNTIAGFTFPVTDGRDVYQIDEIETLVRDHSDGDPYAEGDDAEGWFIRVRQQAIKPAIGSGWTEAEAWADAAKEILSGANSNGFSNSESWDDLTSAQQCLDENPEETDEWKQMFRDRIATLESAAKVTK